MEEREVATTTSWPRVLSLWCIDDQSRLEKREHVVPGQRRVQLEPRHPLKHNIAHFFRITLHEQMRTRKCQRFARCRSRKYTMRERVEE